MVRLQNEHITYYSIAYTSRWSKFLDVCIPFFIIVKKKEWSNDQDANVNVMNMRSKYS